MSSFCFSSTNLTRLNVSDFQLREEEIGWPQSKPHKSEKCTNAKLSKKINYVAYILERHLFSIGASPAFTWHEKSLHFLWWNPLKVPRTQSATLVGDEVCSRNLFQPSCHIFFGAWKFMEWYKSVIFWWTAGAARLAIGNTAHIHHFILHDHLQKHPTGTSC